MRVIPDDAEIIVMLRCACKPLAVSLGIGHESLVNLEGYAPKIKPENVVIIGARSLDEGERKYIKESGMKVYTCTPSCRFP